MEIGIKEAVTAAYMALAALELTLYVLTDLAAFYIIPLVLTAVATGLSLRLGHELASILVWATGIVTFVFGSSAAYASLSLGSASIVFGYAMVLFSIGAIALTVYVSLKLPEFGAVELED